EVSLGTLTGAMDLVAGAPDASGVAPVTAAGPVVFSAAILGGSYGTYCVRIESCTGMVDCDGGSASGVTTVQDSAGPGVQGKATVVTTGVGNDGGPGSLLLDCQQSYVQLLPGEGTDCAAAAYPAPARVVYTTGRADGLFTSADAKVGSASLSLTGENFACSSWPREDGPGALVGMFLVEDDPQAGDLANANRIDD